MNKSWQSTESFHNLAPLAAVFEASLAVIAVLLGWWWGIRPGESLDIHARSLAERTFAIGWGLAASVPPLAALWFAHRLDWRAFSSVRDVVERQVVPWFARSTKAEFAVLALAAGFGEEFLFRGLLQDGLIRWCGEGAWAITIGMMLAALVFGVCHALNRAYFALATFMGLYLGVLYWWTGDLLAPILTHALYDYVALVWLVRRPTAAEK